MSTSISLQIRSRTQCKGHKLNIDTYIFNATTCTEYPAIATWSQKCCEEVTRRSTFAESVGYFRHSSLGILYQLHPCNSWLLFLGCRGWCGLLGRIVLVRYLRDVDRHVYSRHATIHAHQTQARTPAGVVCTQSKHYLHVLAGERVPVIRGWGLCPAPVQQQTLV